MATPKKVIQGGPAKRAPLPGSFSSTLTPGAGASTSAAKSNTVPKGAKAKTAKAPVSAPAPVVTPDPTRSSTYGKVKRPTTGTGSVVPTPPPAGRLGLIKGLIKAPGVAGAALGALAAADNTEYTVPGDIQIGAQGSRKFYFDPKTGNYKASQLNGLPAIITEGDARNLLGKDWSAAQAAISGGDGGRASTSDADELADFKIDPNDPTHVREMQTFLRNQGYKIKVTGKRDDLTNAAVADWHGDRNPKGWTGAPAPAAQSGAAAPPAAPPASAPTYTPPAATAAPAASGIPAVNPVLIDADRARKLTMESFMPGVRNARQDISRQGAQSQQNQADIERWFGGLDAASQGQQTQDDAFLRQLLGGHDQATQGLLSGASDPAARDMLAKLGVVNRTGLTGLAANQHNYTSNSMAATRQGGVDMSFMQGREDASQADKLRSALTDMLNKRASAVNSQQFDIDGKNQAAVQDAENKTYNRGVAERSFKLQESTAALTNWLTGQMAGSQIEGGALANDLLRAKINEINNPTAPALTQPQQTALYQNLYGRLMGENGPRDRPRSWLSRILAVPGASANPSIALQVLQSVMQDAHARGQYTWLGIGADGQIVQTGKPPAADSKGRAK